MIAGDGDPEPLDEQALSEIRWRSLFTLSPFGIAVYRPDGTVKHANEALGAIYGLSVEERERARREYNVLLDPQLEAEGLLDPIRRAFAGEVQALPRVAYDLSLPGREQPERRWIDCVMFPILDSAGRVCEVISFQRDVTSLEEALRESEERFREIAENIREVFWLYDGTEQRVLFASPAFEAIWGRPVEDLCAGHRLWIDSIHPEDRAAAIAAFERIPESAEGVHWEYRILRPDGEVRWIADRGFAIRDEAGEVIRFTGVADDITDARLEEDERRRFEGKVQHAQKLESLGVLAGGIAHEFNNLLVGLLGNADLALRSLPPESPGREFLTKIQSAAERASKLTGQMLAYSGQGRFVVDSIELNRIVDEMGHLLRTVISKKAKLHLHLSDDLPAIEADSSQIRQVVMNLITNAAEAIGEGSGEVHVVTRALDADEGTLADADHGDGLPTGRYVSLEVSDDGCGMDEATRPRIFDPFFSTKFTGRGLGLAAVLGIVRGHHAAIRVETEPGRGSTFSVLFPAATPPSPAPQSGKEQTGLSADSETILVVDDEKAVREVAGEMLKLEGYDVLYASDGHEGIEILESFTDRIALVLLDLTMPRMDGEEALAKIREFHPHLPVILTSGYSRQVASRRIPGASVSGFLQKPYSAEHLARVVREALERR